LFFYFYIFFIFWGWAGLDPAGPTWSLAQASDQAAFTRQRA